jgi:hypothetical protein
VAEEGCHSSISCEVKSSVLVHYTLRIPAGPAIDRVLILPR